MRLLAGILGLALALGMGFQSVVLFCIGLMLAPFLLKPVWSATRLLRPPILVIESEGITRLGLNGRN